MLRSQTTNLSPEQQQRLHADFVDNERAYLQMRPRLLSHYRGQWVAVHQGQVIAAGDNLLKVTEEAAASGGHPYIAKVGEEDQVVFRIRQVQFPYDRWSSCSSPASTGHGRAAAAGGPRRDQSASRYL